MTKVFKHLNIAVTAVTEPPTQPPTEPPYEPPVSPPSFLDQITAMVDSLIEWCKSLSTIQQALIIGWVAGAIVVAIMFL